MSIARKAVEFMQTGGRSTILAALIGIASPLAAGSASWTHLGGDASRSSTLLDAPDTFDRVAWVRQPAADEEFVGLSSPVVWSGRVYVNTRHYTDGLHDVNRIVCYAEAGGARLWSADIEPDANDSWATPAVDARNGSVIIATGRVVTAVDALTGVTRWTRQLNRTTTNVSIAISDDLGTAMRPANRVFVTDFNPFGSATLYAINIDPFHSSGNPFQPGQIAWSANFTGSSGNSPSYKSGRVVISTTGGVLRCYNASTGGAPLWSTPVPNATFFGGLSIADGSVFAASYAFDSQPQNARLVKVDLATGQLRWSVPCERTDSIPVIADKWVYLSGGINGFAGSAARVQAFEQVGNTALLRWDTYTDTAGGLNVGGWATQPAYCKGFLYVGAPGQTGEFPDYQAMMILDTRYTPSQSGFVHFLHVGSGGSPALTNGRLYSIGAGGLFALGNFLTMSDLENNPNQMLIQNLP